MVTVSGGGNVGKVRGYPIVAGSVAGLTTGLVGLLVTSYLYGTLLGGMVGAVGCGVTAVYLSGDGLIEGLIHAVVADVVSSVVFFFLVYFVFVWVMEGPEIVSAAYFGVLYLVFGLGFAIPVAVASLAITFLSATATFFIMHHLAEPTASG